MEGLEVLFSFLLGMIFFVMILGIAVYVINSLFLFGIAKDHKMNGKWMAWVPLFNTYYFGKVVSVISNDPSYLVKYLVSIAAYILIPIIGAIAELEFLISLAGIAAIAYLVFYVIGLYRIYLRYCPDSAVIFTILSFITPIQIGLIIYMLVSKIGKLNKEIIVEQQYIEDNYQNYQ